MGRSKIYQRIAGAVVGLALVVGTPVAANAKTFNSMDAENLRKLDIMLMVSSLRCRTGPHNFQPDYQKFARTHLPTMNAAANRLKADLRKRHGPKSANRALDKISVGMANRYGQGHPWLGCRELKEITRDLTNTRGDQLLLSAANELLAVQRPGRLALAGE